MNKIAIIKNIADKNIKVQLLPEHQIFLTVPHYQGHDPFNRIGQKGVLVNIEFDVMDWSCTFKLVFDKPDTAGNYHALFDFLVFTSDKSINRITEVEEIIDNILELLSNKDLQSMVGREFDFENSDELINKLKNNNQ